MNEKMNVEKIVVDGKEYVPADSIKSEFTGDIKIVILQRGWVMIGRFEKNGNECKLHNASVIRIWGTTKGLGELAEKGTLPNTKLDKCYGLVEFDYLTVVASINCNEAIWKNLL